MRRAIEKSLARYNLEIVGTAGNGEEALDLVLRLKPDLVTLDITMPKMDGLTCLERIMATSPSTKVLVISALTDRATGLKALKKGASGFLGKPFTPEHLGAELERILHD